MKGLFRILFFGIGQLLIRWIDDAKRGNGVGPLNRFQRGCVHAFTWLVVMVMIGLSNPVPASSTRSVASSTTVSTTTRAPAAPSDPMPDAASSVQINRVIDGDTFELANGKKVRVLGIDSCEDHNPKTPGGADATALATYLLNRGTVTLSSQPGAPDVDHFGRLLRYVQVDGEDFGLQMVGWDHTGVYEGDNDASDAYVKRLYAHDRDHTLLPAPAGRECGSYPPPVEDFDDHYVPVPDNDDGDDGESRFCRKRWWC
jgi:endonuclease YncB( thermonuclease family)